MTDRKSCRKSWNERHRAQPVGAPSAFLSEIIERFPRSGLALDVAAGRGRNSLALAHTGMAVIAVDYSLEALTVLQGIARSDALKIYPLATDLTDFPLREQCYDAIVVVNFLDRGFIPRLNGALRDGGLIVVDTFLVEQAQLGHPRNPDFLLNHGELRELLRGLEILLYREGLIRNENGKDEWRASALATRR